MISLRRDSRTVLSTSPFGKRHKRFAYGLSAAALLAAMFLIAPAAFGQQTAVQVAAGGYHTCAALSDGRVKCWGYNAYGQLGTGDTNNRGDGPGEMGSSLPEIFLNQSGAITQLALGAYHTCVLDAVGDVRCWGYNGYGQLGYGNTNNLGDNPGEVSGGLNAAVIETKKIAAGFYHTCALKYDGSVWCWGYNGYGQLGAGDTQNRRDGVNNSFAIPSLGTGRHAIDIAAGAYSTCALLDNNSLKCWGYNGVGTLGLGDTAYRGDNPGEMGDALPAVDMGLAGWGIKQIAMGAFHTCAVRANNSWPKCWGYNVFGQLGLGDTNSRGDNPGEMGGALPFMPAGNTSWQVSLGAYHTCVPAWSGLAGRSGVKCFGYNGSGQLGQGDTVSRGGNPGDVAFGNPPNINLGTEPATSFAHKVLGIASGIYHTCALLGDGTIKCWGSNTYGQLGLGDNIDRGTNPAQMGNALPVVDL